MATDISAVLTYLGLPQDFKPSPAASPIEFLSSQFRYLPPNLLSGFSTLTTPKERTTIPSIRNRRLNYTNSKPPELEFSVAVSTWPTLWHGRETFSREKGAEEQQWADGQFLGSSKKHVGKLGTLLGTYEEEREAERIRAIRREEREHAESIPEEDDDSDAEEEDGIDVNTMQDDSPQEAKSSFERLVKERLIYGLLDHFDYNKVDWDEEWDPVHDMDEEDRWFDDEDADE